jgi:hypothetical protein
VTTRAKPTHDLLTNLLQHRENGHPSCSQELCVKGLRDVGGEMPVSPPFEIQIRPMFRTPCWLIEPFNTLRVQSPPWTSCPVSFDRFSC